MSPISQDSAIADIHEEPLDQSLLRIGAAIAVAHSAAFQAMMLDIIQRHADNDPEPIRQAVLNALQPEDPMGAGRHILQAVRTTLSAHHGAGDDIAIMADNRSPLAIVAGMAGMDASMTAASTYAFQALQLAVDATIAAIANLPEVAAIAHHAVGPKVSALDLARHAVLPMRMLSALLDENGTVPIELALAARSRLPE